MLSKIKKTAGLLISRQKFASIAKKVWHFIKYHNAFTVGLAVCLVLGSVVFASEGVRNAVLGEKVVEREGIDNTALLTADLDSLVSEARITRVEEDNQYYYLTYIFPTMKIIDNVWQAATSTEMLKVSKGALGSQDLGLYAIEEIGEVVAKELAYLKEVQQIESQKGVSLARETTTYTALIGLVLNPTTRELPGYQPVVQPEEPEPFVAIAGRDEAGQRRAASEKLAEQQSQSPEAVPQSPQGSEAQPPGIETAGVGPETVIVLQPDSPTTSTEALFSFGSTLANSTFQCKINQLDWYDCESPKTYVGLTPGDYIFKVYAIAENGSYDRIPAQYSWTIISENDQLPNQNTEEIANDPIPNDETTTTDEQAPIEPEPENTTTTEQTAEPATTTPTTIEPSVIKNIASSQEITTSTQQ